MVKNSAYWCRKILVKNSPEENGKKFCVLVQKNSGEKLTRRNWQTILQKTAETLEGQTHQKEMIKSSA
jgi:hypothetical protein